jgi:L-ascorbate metabolism protein UlaG (beta-lactamase superfamily)
VPNGVEAGGLTIMRTGGQHGTGAIGQEMGAVSGWVVSAPREPTIYVAGDTVWCDAVADAIATHEPAVIVVNAGAARFVAGDPITMDVADVQRVCDAAPDALVVAVHMEAINHCGLTRTALREALDSSGHSDSVMIPADGETLQLTLPETP